MNTKDNVPSQGEFIDLWGLVRRHQVVIAMNMVLCGVLGAAYFAVTPRVYESRAEVLIEQKHSPAFNDQTIKDRPTFQNGVETHMLVLKSPMILDAADDAHGIRSFSEFEELQGTEFLEHWDEHLILSIPETNANVLSVSFRGKDPEEVQTILNSVVAAYEDHLHSKSAGIGKEITSLVAKAKEDLLGQLDGMEDEYATFRRQAPVMWKEGAAVNLHNERQIDLETRRKELLIEKSITEAKLTSVLATLRDGGKSGRDAIYYEALIELRQAEEKDLHVEREAARGYSQELSREYMVLSLEEKQMAAEFGSGHPDLRVLRQRLTEMKADLKRALGEENQQDKLGGAKVDYVEVYKRMLAERITSLRNQIEWLDNSFAKEEKAGNKIEEFLIEDERHRTAISRTQTLFDAVVARLEEINIIQDYGGETMELIAQPELGEQIWPSIPIVGALSAMLGLLLGGCWALIREITDRVFHDPREIREVLQVPVLGQIPHTDPSAVETLPQFASVAPQVGTVHNSKSRFAETIRGVRTALQFSSHRKDLRAIQITSALPGDGKSTVASNLAVSVAKSGKRVLLMDADMRRPQVHKIFGLPVENGLADVLQDRMELSDAFHSTAIENLSIMTAGYPPEDPAELLSGDLFPNAIASLKERFDLIIVDSPPLLAVSDPSIISTCVDGVTLIIKIRRGVRQTALKAKEILDEVDSNLIGAVVNGVAGRLGQKTGYGYQYGYGYGYGYTGANKYYEKSASELAGPAANGNGNGHGQSVVKAKENGQGPARINL